MGYTRGKCWICHDTTAVDAHHLVPLEYGGDKDGRQVNLCAKDHKVAHFEALSYVKTGEYQFDIPDSPEGQRLKRIIAIIVDSKLKFDTGAVEDTGNQRRITQVHWDTTTELTMAHDLKRILGFKSLERCIKACVFHVYEEQRRKGNL